MLAWFKKRWQEREDCARKLQEEERALLELERIAMRAKERERTISRTKDGNPRAE